MTAEEMVDDRQGRYRKINTSYWCLCEFSPVKVNVSNEGLGH